MTHNASQRELALLAAGRVEHATSITPIGADGAKLSDAKRDELLAKCAAGEYVELTIELVAYEHKAGQPNRRHVRLGDDAVAAAARSAIGRPFIRDHEQGNSLARGGTIIDSRGVRAGDGRYEIRQRVQLTAPWAVELALRGLLSFLSVGLRATGPVTCSSCGTEALAKCGHLPGDQVEGRPVEWIYTSAEIVETSSTNVPAVPGAHIESIRAALSAAVSNSGTPPQRITMYSRLATMLSLAATASETEILAAVEGQARRIHALETENRTLKEAQLAAETQSFLDEAIGLGKIAPADRRTWEMLYAQNQAGAVELMAERRPGSATPVGRPRQSREVAAGEGSPSARLAADQYLSASGVNPEAVRNFARMFGAKDIDKTLADAIGSKE